MCHPAWGPAHAPAPYPRELERVRRLRDAIDRDAHDDAWRLPPDVAAEFTRAYGMPPGEYRALRAAMLSPSPL